MVRALRGERRTISERQPVTISNAVADADTVQDGGTDARSAGNEAGVQPAPPSGPSRAVPHCEGDSVPATDADTVLPARQTPRASAVPSSGPHPGLDPSTAASAHTDLNPKLNPNARPHAGADDRRAAAACSALRGDAPELLETLKRHGIAGRLALLDDVSAAGRNIMAPGSSGGALSQVDSTPQAANIMSLMYANP